MGIDTTELQHARFLAGERVQIYNTTDKNLDGQICEVLGRNAILPGSDFYIIMLERPVLDAQGGKQLAMSLTEHCLRPI